MALKVNEVFHVRLTGSTAVPAPIPIRCQLDENELVLSAEPGRGDASEHGACAIIRGFVQKFTAAGVPITTLARTRNGRSYTDCIRIRTFVLPAHLKALLPEAVHPYLR